MGAAVDYVASTVHTDSRIFCGVYIRILSVRLYCIVVWCTLHCTVQHRTHGPAVQACIAGMCGVEVQGTTYEVNEGAKD